MKVTQSHRFDENARTRIVVREFMAQYVGTVERMLEYCDLHDRFSLTDYVESLERRLCVRISLRKAVLRDWVAPAQEMPRVSLFPSLAQTVVEFLATRLQEDALFSQPSDDGSVELASNDVVRAFLHLRYLMAEALDDHLPRMTALEFFKAFVDFDTTRRSASVPDSSALNFEWKNPPPFTGSFNAIQFAIGEGKSCALIQRCRWHEALREFGDSERAYAVACHYDFVAARRSGRNIHLTRTRTCIVSALGCDFAWHDRRTSDMRHPGPEIWKEAEQKLRATLGAETSPELKLRLVREEDLETIHRWANTPATYGDYDEPWSPSRERIQQKWQDGDYKTSWIFWVGDTPIGFGEYVIHPWDEWMACIGVFVAEVAWRGRGLGSRAHAALVKTIFDSNPAVFKVGAWTDTENLAEQRALEKAGFLREGTQRRGNRLRGEFRDMAFYGILR